LKKEKKEEEKLKYKQISSRLTQLVVSKKEIKLLIKIPSERIHCHKSKAHWAKKDNQFEKKILKKRDFKLRRKKTAHQLGKKKEVKHQKSVLLAGNKMQF